MFAYDQDITARRGSQKRPLIKRFCRISRADINVADDEKTKTPPRVTRI
jgi:hypothetical protein